VFDDKKYIKDAIRTESQNFKEIKERLESDFKIRLLHAVLGLETETGELQEAFKKHIFYGKDLDLVNVKEEVGDMMWYLALLCDTLKISFEEVCDKNIEKLKIRYPDKFEQKKALKRDLKKERKILARGRSSEESSLEFNLD